MYEAILVTRVGLYKKEQAGKVLCENTMETFLKTIAGVSPEECHRKVDEFLRESEFISLREKGAANAHR